jgi:hypothetical protein
MGWIDTWWVITMMEDTHACGDRPIDYYPGNAMGPVFTLFDIDPTVPIFVVGFSPLPAIGFPISRIPEPLYAFFR